MGIIEGGLLASFVLALFLVTVFRFETVRGQRFFNQMRNRFDFWVLEVVHSLHVAYQTFFKYVLKQILHFTLHSFLASLLRFAKALERSLAHMMRENRSRARSMEQKNRERNKLEEIALHKIEVALTEEEKRAHRQKTLEGD